MYLFVPDVQDMKSSWGASFTLQCICRFDFDAMCDLKGNTAVYLLYAHARISSIVRKANRPEVSDGSLAKTGTLTLEHPSEIALALHLIRSVL